MPIIISKNGKNAKRVEKISFKKEEDLLKYISDNPETALEQFRNINEDLQNK